MIEAFILKSRGRDMVCLMEYKSHDVRGEKVILYKHGFFGNKITPHRMMVNVGHELQTEGYTIVRFDCVGAGDSEGDSRFTTIPGEIEDTKVVLHWIHNQIRPKKFMILGYSMGGIVASVCCNEVPLDGILLWSPCSDPVENFTHIVGEDNFRRGLMGEDVELMGDLVCKEFFAGLDAPELNPLKAIAGFKMPLRLIHGDGDTDVPAENSKRYEQTHPGSVGHVITGANHSYDKICWQKDLMGYTKQYVHDIMK